MAGTPSAWHRRCHWHTRTPARVTVKDSREDPLDPVFCALKAVQRVSLPPPSERSRRRISLGLHLLKVRHCTPARSVGVTELRGLSDDAVPSRLASWTTLREAGRRGAAAADVLSVTYILRHSLLCAAWRRRRRWRWQAWDPPSAWSAAPVTYTAPFLAAPAPLPFPFPSLPLSSPLLQDTHYDTRRARNSARFPSFKIPAL